MAFNARFGFVQHLPAFGWEPLVLTVTPGAYERTAPDLSAEVPPGTVVRRALALDTARHLSLGGRYVGAMARPDRWISWRFDGVRQGMRLIRELQPSVIWSTYPIATAHVIGAELHRRSGLPWVADFRDPMAQDGYPEDAKTRRQFLDIEAHAVRHARLSTFTTPSAAAEYRRRYPEAADRVRLLENGYDEESFAAAAAQASQSPLTPGAVTLLHSGIVYPSERDPTQLMAALRLLHDAGTVTPQTLRIRFRAAVAEELLQTLAARHGVQDYIETCPPVPYAEALVEMLRADGLLLLQASNCNAQVPAKLYEYLRAGRPLLCLSDRAGDTANVLRAAGVDSIAQLDDANDIAGFLGAFLQPKNDHLRLLASAEFVEASSRRNRSRALVDLLGEVLTPHGAQDMR